MRLIIKAHKYLKRWRGPSGKYHYQYAREKGTIAKGEFKKISVPEQSIYINVDNKKMLVPREQVLAAFEKFGVTWFVVPHFDHAHQKINPNTMQVIEINSGLRIKTFDTSDPQEAIRLAVADADAWGYDKVTRTVNQAKAIVDLPDHSKAIQAYGEKPPTLDAAGKLALVKMISEKLDDLFDEAVVLKWLISNYNESELPEIWVKELHSYDDYILEMAIKENIDLEDAGNLMAGTSAVLEVARQHGLKMELDEIEDWISNVGMKDDLMQEGDDHLGQFAYYNSALGTIDYDDVVARALQQGVHPDEIEGQLNEEAAQMHEEEEEEQAAADYGETAYTTGYNYDKAVFYDLPQEKAEKALRSGTPLGGAVLKGGINGTFRIQLENGDSVEAVFKPKKGEYKDARPNVPTGEFYIREAAAYELDKMLGINMVPPTIVMEIDGDIGSAQYFKEAENALMVSDWSANAPIDQITKAALLDYLIYNTDRHENNFMIDNNNNIILIDNGLVFPTYEGYYNSPFKDIVSEEHENVPPDIYKRMEDITLKGGLEQKFLSMGLDQKSVDGLVNRWDKVLESGKVVGGRW